MKKSLGKHSARVVSVHSPAWIAASSPALPLSQSASSNAICAVVPVVAERMNPNVISKSVTKSPRNAGVSAEPSSSTPTFTTALPSSLKTPISLPPPAHQQMAPASSPSSSAIFHDEALMSTHEPRYVPTSYPVTPFLSVTFVFGAPDQSSPALSNCHCHWLSGSAEVLVFVSTVSGAGATFCCA